MAYPVTLNGRTYTLADFEGVNYVEGLPDAFEDFVTHAGDIYNDTSTTSNAIGTGSKTFTVSSGKPYQAGTPLRIADAAAPATNFLDAVVTSYSGTTLVVEAVGYGGSGTKTSWTVNIGGAKTADGTLGVSQGGTGATTAAAALTNLGTYSKTEADSRFLNVSGEASDVTMTGNVTIGDADTDTFTINAATTATANISFGDNDKAIFGAGSDLQIYHDGVHSRVDDTGTGKLILRGNDAVEIHKYTGEYMITAAADGAVRLYHDDSQKLATTNTGVDVTGTITSDGLTVDGVTTLYGNGNAPLAWGDTSDAGFLSFDGSGNAIVRSATGARLNFQVNANRDVLSLQNGSTIFNEGGLDQDFRVESDNNTHAFFVDAGEGKVRINSTLATDGVLLVKGADQAHPVITVSGSNSNGFTLLADRYQADESILNIGMGYSGANPTFSRSVKPSTTTESAFISSQDSFAAQPAALEIKNDGFRFYHTRTSATTAVDSTVSLTNFLHISGDGIIANDAGTADADFRVESDSRTDMLVVDASANRVGIKTSAPVKPLALGSRTGANLTYINGTTNTVEEDNGIFVSASTTNESSVAYGLHLANNANTNGARSPIIGFSALSASDGYNHMYAAINGVKTGNGSDTNWNTGSIDFSTGSGTGPNVRMTLNYLGGLTLRPLYQGSFVWNEDSQDADFRVESDNNANAFNIDAGKSTIGMGSNYATPSAPSSGVVVDFYQNNIHNVTITKPFSVDASSSTNVDLDLGDDLGIAGHFQFHIEIDVGGYGNSSSGPLLYKWVGGGYSTAAGSMNTSVLANSCTNGSVSVSRVDTDKYRVTITNTNGTYTKFGVVKFNVTYG